MGNPVGSTIIRIGGAIFIGALLAVILGYLMIASMNRHPSNSSGFEGFGFGVALLMLAGAGFVVGFFVGLWLMGKIVDSPSFRILGIFMALAGFGAGGYALSWYLRIQSSAVDGAARARAAADEHKMAMAAYTKAFLKKAPVDVPPLYGEFYYPDSEILGGTEDYSRVELLAPDHIEKVVDYYRSRATESQPKDKGLTGKGVRPGDGRKIYFSVEKSGARAMIILVEEITGPFREPATPPAPAAEPTDPGAALAADPNWVPASGIPELTQSYGSLLYAGASTNFPSVNSPHPEIPASMAALTTTDSVDTVIGYYRPLTTASQDQPGRYVGTTTRADGRTVFITVERKEPYTIVTLSTLADQPSSSTG